MHGQFDPPDFHWVSGGMLETTRSSDEEAGGDSQQQLFSTSQQEGVASTAQANAGRAPVTPATPKAIAHKHIDRSQLNRMGGPN